MKYINDWAEGGEAEMLRDFDIKSYEGEVLLASYTYESYSGSAFVLIKKDGMLYEVNGSHCSCYGLEAQWELEATSKEELLVRLNVGNFGKDYNGTNEFANELIEVLNGEIL
jgi:hypothetical protein